MDRAVRHLLGFALSFALLLGATAGCDWGGQPGGSDATAGAVRGRDVADPSELIASLFPAGVESLDGNGNNLAHPEWGRMGNPYARIALPAYADGVGSMVQEPSPRYVSNRVFNDVGQNVFSENGVTAWAFTWGQFLDHNFGLRQSEGERRRSPSTPNDPLEGFTDDLGVDRVPAHACRARHGAHLARASRSTQ